MPRKRKSTSCTIIGQWSTLCLLRFTGMQKVSANDERHCHLRTFNLGLICQVQDHVGRVRRTKPWRANLHGSVRMHTHAYQMRFLRSKYTVCCEFEKLTYRKLAEIWIIHNCFEHGISCKFIGTAQIYQIIMVVNICKHSTLR